MKKILLLVALAAFAFSASAQRAESRMFSFRKADQPVTFGIRAGVNFSGVADKSTDSDFNNFFNRTKTGFNVGLNMDVPILTSFYIQTGLYFTTKGGRYQESARELYEVKATLNPMYLELPVYASWRLDCSKHTQIQVNIGPYFGVAVGGKAKYSEKSEKLDYSESEKEPLFGKDAILRRGDIGLGVGAGITVHKIYLGFNYSFGFNNLVKDVDDSVWYKFRNRNFTIQTGFNF